VADEYFKGVNCTSESDCWAVGHYFFADPTLGVWRTLIEHWDGASWSIVSSPNANTNGDNYLTSITCVSASECWAVGYYSDRPGSQLYRTLTLRWAGGSWSIVSSANTDSAQANLLNGVTCMSASECWAVGYSGSGSENRALIERWDGTSWSIVSSPNIGTGANQLFSVACTSDTDCWTVGRYYPGPPVGGLAQTLIERWNGTSWTIVASPNVPDQGTNSQLLAVACASASECWAVGYSDLAYDGTTGTAQTLTEHWDGTSWTIVFSPNVISIADVVRNFLTGVTCAGSDCWAVGYYHYQSNPKVNKALIQRLNGGGWTISQIGRASCRERV